jgi:hypothetical protein
VTDRFSHPAADADVDAPDDAEVVDAVPVPEPGEVGPHLGAEAPAPAPGGLGGARGLVVAAPVAVQAAAVAVTGFAAGAATVAVVRKARARKQVRTRRKDSKTLGEIRATRSFLVDVHLLNRD